MPTNEERREVAQRLRELAAEKFDLLQPESVMVEISKTIGDPDGWDSLTVLADLIEPEPERTCKNVACSPCAFRCSNCGWFDKDRCDFNFCPNCGKKVMNHADR